MNRIIWRANSPSTSPTGLATWRQPNKNSEDVNDVTPLIEACIAGDEEMAKLFLDSGCPAQPSGGFHHSPLRDDSDNRRGGGAPPSFAP